MKRGFLMGKFYPPHKGHHFLIDEAAKHCDELIVLVQAASHESFPLELRHQDIAEQHPGVVVRSDVVDLPVDFDDPKIWDLQIQAVRRMVPENIDVVFAAENYGPELARRLGAAYHEVDPLRTTFPVSGTLVRQDPFASFDMLSPLVRAFFVKRVVVVGAESTGTTTLTKALAKHYQTVWVPEYGREYSTTKPEAKILSNWKSEEFIVIAARQQEMEDQAAQIANKVLISDTDALTTALFEEMFLGTISSTVLHMARSRVPDLYVLTSEIEVPFEDDGTRCFESQRAQMNQRFREELDKGPAPWIEVQGTPEERLDQVIQKVDKMILQKFFFAKPFTEPTKLVKTT